MSEWGYNCSNYKLSLLVMWTKLSTLSEWGSVVGDEDSAIDADHSLMRRLDRLELNMQAMFDAQQKYLEGLSKRFGNEKLSGY